MQNIKKRSKRITSNLSNLRLIHQRIIKQIRRILLLLRLGITRRILPLQCLLLRRRPGDVKSHLNQLILARASFLALPPRTTQRSIRPRIIAVGRE